MPLHLLGKKSWNVYNPENIARVQRDEAAAKAENERAEREERSNASASRLQALRGEVTSEVLPSNVHERDEPRSDTYKKSASRKRRKLVGENDTDRDIRLAKSDMEDTKPYRLEDKTFDVKGHIDLIPGQNTSQRPQQGEKQDETQGMRFKDAAGYKSDGTPWYTTKLANYNSERSIGKDVWGNEDPRRRDREQHRMITNDPLLAMRQGVKKLRENEKQRNEWIEQRERDLYEVEVLARAREKRHRHSSDDDSLKDFSLDAPSREPDHERGDLEKHKRRHDRKRRHKHRHRSRSPGKEDRRHRHRSRSTREPAVADQC